MHWFEIDKKGLAKILARKGKAFAALELLQNAWDQDVETVSLCIKKSPGSRYATIEITDDDPNGFADLADTFTLFAESKKKSDPTKRGRFNIGEKLVLSLCEEAEIRTVKGTVKFNATGRHRLRSGTTKGSVFTGRLLMTNTELSETLSVLHRVIVPDDIITSINGEVLEPRTPISVVEATLATGIADENGYLRSSHV